MARPLRLQFRGALYHALARGNEKSAIFLNDDDCGIFLELLNRVASRHRWRLWAHCLMPNHYHLLVETMEPTLARGMRDLNGSYAQLFNRSHDRVGHLFQGRYKSLLVDREAYLLEVARYIVLNPVRARLCSAPGDWRWSSYRASMETAVDGPALAAAELLALFSSNRAEARRRYATFVASGVNVPAPAWTTACGAFLGDDDFVAASVQQAPPHRARYHAPTAPGVLSGTLSAPRRRGTTRFAWPTPAGPIRLRRSPGTSGSITRQ